MNARTLFFLGAEYATWLGQHLVAAGATWGAISFLALAGSQAMDHFGAPASTSRPGTEAQAPSGSRQGGLVPNELDKLGSAMSSAERYEKVMDSVREQTQAVGTTEANKEPPALLRELIVDFGPPRSRVFVRGREIGRTPYAGQITCKAGDRITVDVMPAQGMPIRRTFACHADLAGSASSAGPANAAGPGEPLSRAAPLQKLLPEVQP
jgi:hypothetical protein